MSKEETFAEFAARHGECIEIGIGVKLFADGAMATEGGLEGSPSRREPPSDPVEALRLRRRFEEARRRTEVESYFHFAQRHGGQPVLVDRRLLFADGAECDQTTMFRIEPPTDPATLLRARKRYIEAKLRNEISAFEAFQSDCNEMARFAVQNRTCCPPPADAADQLRRGKQRIADLRKQLAALNDQLGGTPEGRVQSARRDSESERQHQLAEQLREIAGIRLD